VRNPEQDHQARRSRKRSYFQGTRIDATEGNSHSFALRTSAGSGVVGGKEAVAVRHAENGSGRFRQAMHER